MGRVTTSRVEEGQRVKKGQFLLEIDPRNLRTRLQSGEASLAGAALHGWSSCGSRSKRAKANLKAAQDTFRRQQQL